MDAGHLLAHLNALEPDLRADCVFRAGYADEVLGELRDRLAAWDGEDLPALFSAVSDGMVAYALARVVHSAPGFAPAAPSRAGSVEPTGAEEFERVIAGDLHVGGDVGMYNGEALIVLGDLHANAVSADETAHVIVAGTVTARSVWSEGNVLANDINAELVYGSYEAGTLGVSGTLRARLVVNNRHGFAAGSVEAGFVFDGDTGFLSPQDEQRLDELAVRVPQSVVVRDGEKGDQLVGRVDMGKLIRHVDAGGSPLA
ncbi:hypothetical protein [Longispora albida]|uniref:hypothetical protein n=1 Tax=Longispora albida TaxID=203523 RepID=UPI00035DA792|nr:hypothetical protein [Longispora albida]